MILDIEGNPVNSFSFSMASETEVEFIIRFLCLDGYTLRSENSDNVAIEGRLVGDVSWANLVSTGIPLTPYSSTYQNFDIRLTADAVTEHVFDAFKIYIG